MSEEWREWRKALAALETRVFDGEEDRGELADLETATRALMEKAAWEGLIRIPAAKVSLEDEAEAIVRELTGEPE